MRVEWCGVPYVSHRWIRPGTKRPAILKLVNCFCGCGTKVPARLIEANLRAGEVALELLAWDKARAADALASDSENMDLLIARGADCYQRLLSTLHEEEDADSPLPACKAWLQDSLRERMDREDMTEKAWSFFSAGKLKLADQDLKRLDRARPELSFSADRSRGGTADADLARQLERLGVLHAEGVLTDEEFSAAKARVLGRA
jgi:hypothetical protein